MSLSGENVPSLALDVLDILKKSKILKAVRFSWWPPEESKSECDIQASEVFSYTEGPLLIYLETGEIVGISSDESINSIVVWVERNIEGVIHDENIENDEELYPVSSNDTTYSGEPWDALAGNKIENITLIKRHPQNVNYEDLPNEVGLQFTMQNGDEYILCHQLCGKTSNFSICDKNCLEGDILGELTYIEV